MRKDLILISMLILSTLAFEGCNNQYFENIKVPSDLQNEYTKVWIKTYGLIDSRQDWCNVSAISADITMPSEAYAISIYNDNPAEGGHLIGRTKQDCQDLYS